jgi:outer membrane lipoprotein-sorting protein
MLAKRRNRNETAGVRLPLPDPYFKGLTGGLALLFVTAVARAGDEAVGMALIAKAKAVLARTDSYTAVFHKQERVGKTLLPEETIILKFKKPLRIYMKWIGAPHRGVEVVYSEGSNGNRLIAHKGGLLNIINLNLDPRGTLAMRNNRHPVTDTGLDHLILIVEENILRGLKLDCLTLVDRGYETVYGRRARRFEGIFPRNKTAVFYCHRAVISLDAEKNVPVMAMMYDDNDALIEKYGFENVRLDAGLGNVDFDPKNPEYSY